MSGSLLNFSHDEINLAIRVVLGIDVLYFVAAGVYFFVRNERLASKAGQHGNITYTTPFTIHTGIAWGSPECPLEIREQYFRLRRQMLLHGAIAAIPVLVYLVLLRPYFH